MPTTQSSQPGGVSAQPRPNAAGTIDAPPEPPYEGWAIGDPPSFSHLTQLASGVIGMDVGIAVGPDPENFSTWGLWFDENGGLYIQSDFGFIVADAATQSNRFWVKSNGDTQWLDADTGRPFASLIHDGRLFLGDGTVDPTTIFSKDGLSLNDDVLLVRDGTNEGPGALGVFAQGSATTTYFSVYGGVAPDGAGTGQALIATADDSDAFLQMSDWTTRTHDQVRVGILNGAATLQLGQDSSKSATAEAISIYRDGDVSGFAVSVGFDGSTGFRDDSGAHLMKYIEMDADGDLSIRGVGKISTH